MAQIGLLEMLSVIRQSCSALVHQHHVHKPGPWAMEQTSQTAGKLQHTTAGMQTLQTTASNKILDSSQTKEEITIWDQRSRRDACRKPLKANCHAHFQPETSSRLGIAMKLR